MTTLQEVLAVLSSNPGINEGPLLFAEIMCPVSKLKAQGPSRTCNESKEEEEGPLLQDLED